MKIAISLFLLLPLCVLASSADLTYVWKPNDVVRFEYSKTVDIEEKAPVDSSGKPQIPPDPVHRTFKFSAILIIEIHKNRTMPDQLAILRFDSPHIDVPDEYWYSAQSDEITVNPDKDKILERAFEGAVKSARWTVHLGSEGAIRIESRTPKTIEDWLREAEHAANWRGKFRKLWVELVEKNLGLSASGEDHDIFLVAGPKGASAGDFDKIRPVRSDPTLLSLKDNKARYTFLRAAQEARKGETFSITATGTPNITMKLNPAIKTSLGICVFDTFLGLPDSILEEYAFKLDYECTAETKRVYKLAQDVTVKCELKRIAPKLENYEPATELPPAVNFAPAPK